MKIPAKTYRKPTTSPNGSSRNAKRAKMKFADQITRSSASHP